MAAAETLVTRNPSMTFVYVSGRGADSSEKGSVMWARVRGRLENALLAMPFKRVFILRPAIIQPLNGARSKTPWISAMYTVTAPLLSFWRSLSPGGINTTESIGRTMLRLARVGYPKKILESADIADAGSID